MSDHLAGPRAKLQRAEEHLNALNVEINSFKGDEGEIVVYFNPDSGCHVFKVRYVKDLPLRWGVMLGDFVHNARSALDHLVWQLVLLNHRVPGAHNAFPVTDTKDKWNNALRGKLLGVRNDHCAALKLLQPYTRGNRASNHPLFVLDELWNHDKHRVVTPRYAVLADHQPIVEASEGRVIRLEVDSGIPFVPETEFMRVWLDPPSPQAKMNVKSYFPIHPAFGERLLRSRDLKRLGAVVANIIKRPAFCA